MRATTVPAYTYLVDHFGYIFRQRSDGYVNMWKPAAKTWTDVWAPIELVNKHDQAAGMSPLKPYTGPMPEGSLPEDHCAFPAAVTMPGARGKWTCPDCGERWAWCRTWPSRTVHFVNVNREHYKVEEK